MPIYRGFEQASAGTVQGVIYGLPPLGTEGQIVVKSSSNSGEVDWQTSTITLNGLITGTADMNINGDFTVTTSEGTFPYEAILGNPTVDGYILSSTSTGTRSWVSNAALPVGGTNGQVLSKASDDDYDIVWADSGSTASTGPDFCPGYTFNYISTTVWSVVGFDVSRIFALGKRLEFTDGGDVYAGIISAVDYDTTTVGDTTITMTMDATEVLTATITGVCVVNGTTGWDVIATDPFEGTAINGVTTGVIGAVQWWIAVGDGGKLFTSNDAGDTWTPQTSGTTEDLNDCAYDSTNETFAVVGDNKVMFSSTDGSTWSAVTTTGITVTTGTGNIYSLTWGGLEDAWMLQYHYSSTLSRDTKTIDLSTWVLGSATNISVGGLVGSSLTSTQWIASVDDLHFYTNNSDTTASVEYSGTTGVPLTAIGFRENASNELLFLGDEDGLVLVRNATANTTTTGSGFSWPIRSFASSDLHSRVVLVGDNGSIGYAAYADLETTDPWTVVSNGLDPLANITSVAWNEPDLMFVAVADNGQIIRSTNGTS